MRQPVADRYWADLVSSDVTDFMISGGEIDRFKALKMLSVYEYFSFIELKTLAQAKIDGARKNQN